jgi:hypothetical protein
MLCLFSLAPLVWATNPLPPSIPANATRAGWTNEPNDGRGTETIIWQCITTIFLCVYVAQHLNIPPEVVGWKVSLLRKGWWTVVGLLFPEIVCLFAICQWYVARNLAARCKNLGKPISMRQAFLLSSGGVGVRILDQPSRIQGAPNASHDEIRSARIVDDLETENYSGTASSDKLFEHGTVWLFGYSRQGDGLFLYEQGTLSDDGVMSGANYVPADADIDARSKADGLGKSFTMFQTSWILVQIISRAVQHLDVSLLEFATLAYILLTITTYVFWFQKPYDIGAPFVVDAASVSERMIEPTSLHGWHTTQELSWQKYKSVGEVLDHALDFDYSLGGMSDGALLTTTSLLCAVFGGIHCLAWGYAYASGTEAWLWRTTSVLIIVLPLALVILTLLQPGDDFYHRHVEDPLLLSLFILYVLSRIYMIVECFLAFRDAPVGIYRKVSWTAHLGHFGV